MAPILSLFRESKLKRKTLSQDAVSVTRDEKHLQIKINLPVTFKIRDTAANLKLLVVLLRLLTTVGEVNILTFQQIAALLGYPDRRNVNNFWREFESHGGDVLAYLSRKVELAKYASVIESFALKNLLLPIHLMYKQFCLAYTVKMSYPSFCKYLGQINATTVISCAQKMVHEHSLGDGAVQILRLLGSQSNVPVLCDQLLEHSKRFASKPGKASKPPVSMQRQNLCLLVHYLVGKGMNMQTIGMILNVSKVIPIALFVMKSS